MSFVHLHVHSEYSLLEAACELKPLVKKAAASGMPALALTDHGNMYGAIEFYFAAKDAAVKPILGIDAFIHPPSRREKPQGLSLERLKNPPQLVLLATSYRGYQTLCRLSSLAFLEGFYYRPRLDFELLREHNEDVICLSGGYRGLLYQSFIHEGEEKALAHVKELKSIFADRFYLEATRTRKPKEQEFEAWLVKTSRAENIPIVAAQDVLYLEAQDALTQDVLFCIGNNYLLKDPERPRLPSQDFYFKSADEMRSLFSDHLEWCDETLKIAEKVNISFRLKDDKGRPIYHLPSFPTPDGQSLKDYIHELSFKGLAERIQEIRDRGEAWDEVQEKRYQERLHYELDIIDRMGFNGYFLIVSDFIQWAKNQGIPVGPGRGSGAGSLVAFCLRITDLDPMPYHLLFERFLNPERISMPDFDIDFCQDRRAEVIQYVTQKYSSESVCQIITYGKLQCKAAIKDVGRILGMSFSAVDSVTKLVPEKLGITIDEALASEPRLKALMEDDPEVAQLIELARRIEGLNRHAGIHAAGVIIANGKIMDYAPLARGSDGEVVVQYDMKHAEKIGLIKFDFLGLKTLTQIHSSLKLIEQNHGKTIRSQDVSLSDPGIYEIMTEGDTLGIFQFEGEGITDAITKIRPTNFFDITAINALYRPGPLAMIPVYAKRKHGEEPVEYIFPELKDILEETYGIIVYQEQVMAIASKIAGYTLGEADMLRRAMGKKIKEEMDKHRERFLKGATERGFDAKKAEEVFELMYKFADYGFNKSHAAAYCVVAAQTAWLKRYYPVEFFAGLLSTELSNTDKVVQYAKDAWRRGIEIKPPHVNHSDYGFTAKGNTIYFGLGAIKGVGENVVYEILEARRLQPQGRFESLEDFFQAVDAKVLNKKTLEALIKAGALDGLGAHRAQLLQEFHRFVEWAQERQKEKASGQGSLFDWGGESKSVKVVLPPVESFSKSQILKYEKEVIGFYLSDHPLKAYERWMSLWNVLPLGQLDAFTKEWEQKNPLPQDKQKYNFKNPDGNKPKVNVYGLLIGLREVVTKKGTRMAFADLEDLSGLAPLVIFPDTYAKLASVLHNDGPFLVQAFVEKQESSIKLIVSEMTPLAQAFQKIRRLKVFTESLTEDDLDWLQQSWSKYPGSVAVDYYFRDADSGLTAQLFVSEPPKIQLSLELLEMLESRLGTLEGVQPDFH